MNELKIYQNEEFGAVRTLTIEGDPWFVGKDVADILGYSNSRKQQDGEVTAFNEKLWCGLLDYATAYADGRLTFTFKNGSTFEG